MALASPVERRDGLRVVLADIGALTGRQALRTMRSPGKFIGIAMNPVVMILALGLIFVKAIRVPEGVDYRAYIVAGVAVQVGLSCIGPTAISVALDQRSGMVRRLRTMPPPAMSPLIAQKIADLAAAVAALILVSLIGVLLGWRPSGSLGDISLAYLQLILFYAATIAVGIVLGLVFSDPETIEPIGAVSLVIFSFVSNAFLSPDVMPGPIRVIAEWNPVSMVATTCRRLWGTAVPSDGSFPMEHSLSLSLLISTGLIVVCLGLGARILRRAAR
ncbi:ABC transporter permease [Micromonospora sp. NBC_00617]|uniref:ABC transporter permease n=1 Tax=Micromonospora sp. NBC_00617 TaxID=2903587 RepID=UPI0030DE38D5